MGIARLNRHRAALFLTIVLLTALAACGGSDDGQPSDPGDDQAGAGETSEESGNSPGEDDENDASEDDSDGSEAPAQTPTPTPSPMPSPTPTPSASDGLTDLDIDLEQVAEGLIQPTDMAAATDGTDRLFVTSRPGLIHVIDNGQLREEPLLDIREQVEHEMVEQGLLSIELDPDFAENGYLYVDYISHGDENTIVSRYQMAEDGQRVLPESATVILEVEQPHYSHNGGNVKFGPDGYLYIALGDGENPGDPHENAQNPGTLLGSILRIDVNGGDPYAIPPDNPFVGHENARDEIWVYGLRNPWRFSFHPETGDMYIVDVGQWSVEEVNVQPADSPGGENYGWPIMEGDECYEADECDQEGLTMPVATYRNPDQGCAVIGGYSYYGTEYPEMEGVYFFGDWCSGNIRGLIERDGEWIQRIVLGTDLMFNAFGVDLDGEIYVLDYSAGGVFQIVND